MAFSDFTRRLAKFTADNSPAILTALAVTGTVTTAYLSGRAAVRAVQLISDENLSIKLKNSKDRPLDRREEAELVWREFVPPVVMGLATVACVVGANRIGSRRAAAIATAYAISEKAMAEYKDKVVEKIGSNKEQAIRDEVAQDRIRRNPPDSEVIITPEQGVLCYDEWTGRYFTSTVEELRRAENAINFTINNDYYASLTDFYQAIDLRPTKFSDEVGWNVNKLLRLRFTTTMAEDNRPCISVGFDVDPIRGYHRIN